jgi:hypothetical protein
VTLAGTEPSLTALESDVTRRATDALNEGHRTAAREHLEAAVRILDEALESSQ